MKARSAPYQETEERGEGVEKTGQPVAAAEEAGNGAIAGIR
jgi:hypothetical protein